MFNTNKLYTTLVLAIYSCSAWFAPLGYTAPTGSSATLVNDHLVSNIKPDETIQFFHTSAWYDETLQLWHIPIHGWVYEPEESMVRKQIIAKTLQAKYNLKATSKHSENNFAKRVNLLIADNERNKQVIIVIGKQRYALPKSAANGHFKGIITLTKPQVDHIKENGQLDFYAILSSQDQRRFSGKVALVSPEGISVISDIDDTVKVSQVTDHTALMDYTFFQDFIAVKGMSALYQNWSQQGAMFHFVSSSPWHLYQPLVEFAKTAGYPWASYSLKNIRFKDETIFNLFKKGTETKPQQIEPILQAYPKRHFILVGDSGEQDPEVYGELMRKYPEQITKILIRNVDNSSTTDSRYKKAFSNVAVDKWQLFISPQEVKLLIKNK
ncbi:phosphatidate phosphatase App1 family protein [Spartinivicinus ruber]|uniref:phosphatidate phosphatase App1 family protein n=1 Tax=Spartinivicinus ruber TaxID=2683272 RepID=UPI0013D1D7DB|nr:phosphatase domain-containing protein [Spartinivicinus ruber]